MNKEYLLNLAEKVSPDSVIAASVLGDFPGLEGKVTGLEVTRGEIIFVVRSFVEGRDDDEEDFPKVTVGELLESLKHAEDDATVNAYLEDPPPGVEDEFYNVTIEDGNLEVWLDVQPYDDEDELEED